MVTAELPDDVIEAILLLLPVKSLMRFKCVNKSLCALIRKPSFREQHLSHRPDATHLLLSYCRHRYRKYEQTILTTTTNGGATTSDHILPNIIEHGPFNLSSCHGLISMHPCDEAKTNTFVYNPNTRETVTIPFNANAFEDGNSVRSYIGFEPVSNQYKIMILSLRATWISKEYSYSSKHCEIITLGGTNNNWRQVDTNEAPPIVNYNSTCSNGALHWITFDRQHVAVFDLESEKFGTIPGPKTILEGYKSKLCQVGGCLTLVECGTYGGFSLELWTLKDYHHNGVWVKQSFDFSLPQHFGYFDVVGGMSNDEIVMILGLEAFCYDLKGKRGWKINVGREHDETDPPENIMPYTESIRCY